MRYGPESKLASLNNGWPMGEGPMAWDVRHELREGQAHMVCAADGQSVFCLAPDVTDVGFTWNLAGLRARVADHVLRCHEGEIAALTYR